MGKQYENLGFAVVWLVSWFFFFLVNQCLILTGTFSFCYFLLLEENIHPIFQTEVIISRKERVVMSAGYWSDKLGSDSTKALCI